MNQGPKLTVSIAEAADRLGISVNLAYDSAARGELPTIKFGRRLLVPVRRLEELVDRASARSSGGDLQTH